MEEFTIEFYNQYEAFIRHVKTGIMVVACNPGGLLRSHPISIEKVEQNGTIWMVAKKEVSALNLTPKEQCVACVTLSDMEKQQFLSISGTTSVSSEEKEISEIWNPGMQLWFPSEEDRQHIKVIKIIPKEVTYWDYHENPIAQVLQAAQSLISGTPYKAGKAATYTLDK
ncbi:MAG: pyridoxamine 5'-phosphate oxidase family protein [Bacteroidota bacterium]